MFNDHPKGLYVLFFTEMWERFSYYGMRAILTLYMINALLFDKVFTSSVYAYYTGLVYLTPLLGGYVADKYWGNRKSIILGGIMMLIGQLTLSASGFYYSVSLEQTVVTSFSFNIQQILFVIGLFFLIVGNGFFKPNISTMVGSLYPEKSIKIRDAAFTIFYMGINLGALIAPFIAGGLGDTGNPADFKYGFLAAAIGMTVGLITFIFFKDKHLVTPDGDAIGLVPKKESSKSLEEKELAETPLTKIEKQRIAVIFILAFFVIFFWAAFEQAGVSLTFFAEEQTNRVIGWLGNYTIPASFFQAINPVAIIVFAPIFAMIWTKLGNNNKEPNTPLKMALGLFLLAIGFAVLVMGSKIADTGTKISPLWLVGAYTLHTFGELSLSPIGLSMVTKLSPAKFASLLMGIWFMSNAAANWFAGMLSTLYPEAGKTTSILGYSINNLSDFFTIFVVMGLVASIILFSLNKLLSKMMHGIN